MLTVGAFLQNRYRIDALLGQGGMGAVYRAWDTRLNIAVAVKEMIPLPGIDPPTLTEFRQQFQQEAMVLAQLDHPHLVSVTDSFEDGDIAYLVMKFIDGESLDCIISRRGALPEPEVLAWAEQLLDGLAYCHGRGVIHRDIKPKNVIIRSDGWAMLVDFGLVKLWNPADPQTRTVLRGVGTPEFAPPEQYDSQMGHTDPRSDLYSLGATLYNALTGQIPPTAMRRIVNPASLLPARMLQPAVSAQTEAAVMRAMELQPVARFQNAAEMRAVLTGALSAGQPGSKHTASGASDRGTAYSRVGVGIVGTGVRAGGIGSGRDGVNGGNWRAIHFCSLATGQDANNCGDRNAAGAFSNQRVNAACTSHCRYSCLDIHAHADDSGT